VAITLGDPRGIGPEVVEKVLRDPPPGAEYVVVTPDGPVEYPLFTRVSGDWRTVTAESPVFSRVSGDWRTVTAESSTKPTATGLPYPKDLSPADAGRFAGASVESAVRMAMKHEVDAIVTGPAEKRALHLAGYPYPGHTEWLAHLAGDVKVAMMLTSSRLRVVLVTTHIPLRSVPDQLTTNAVIETGTITLNALKDLWGIDNPRIAVCALNPHAGEAGLFGSEDKDVLAPAAKALGAMGPLPADTVFVRAIRGEFDAVLAPYHDVGMTAIKVASFGQAVNVTLGLPFIRTSPDHGTAFDIAGKGVADPSSMREAVRLAGELARTRSAA
jgi:4-hydroxythreonine-4-phosphate dehydrogenase